MISIDGALRQIREAWKSNPDFLDDLRERLTVAHPIPLLPFVGAGLSVPMGFPSWTGFLEGLASECGETAKVAALLGAGQYEEAAAAVETGLGPTLFNERIGHVFGKRKSNECELRGAVRVLPELADGAVVTTNFDRILERCFEDAGLPFEDKVWGAQVDSMRRAVTDNRPFLLKIHGDAEERTDRVLTKAEYDRHYATGDPNGLRAQLVRLFQSRTLLFVGCSLGPDRTMDVLAEVTGQAAGLKHFAIVEKPAADLALFEKQRRLSGHGICPIWYPAGRHDLIEPLLRWIASLRPARPGTGPALVLERPAQRKKGLSTELDLLIPYQRTTTLVGREDELAGLQGWIHSAAVASVRVVTGEGGSGKTRLAVELLEWLEAAEPGQWNCGFLTLAEIERFSSLQNLSQWRRRKPILAVVDYAAGSSDRLRVWLEQLAVAEGGDVRLRLLLLEREASLDSGWMASLIGRGYSEGGVRGLFDPLEPLRLRGVPAAADRHSLISATVQAGAAMRGVEPPKIPASGTDPGFDKRIQEREWGDPLTLMMAGLTALDTGLVAALALGRADLALRLAGRECERVERFGTGAPPELMRHMAAWVTVSGGLSREELGQAAKEESDAIGLIHPTGGGALASSVAEALGGGSGARPVQPDVVGEALLLTVWGERNSKDGCRAVVRATQHRAQAVVASVIRSAQDFCVGTKPRQEPLDWLDALIADAKEDVARLLQIEGEMPRQTLALRERAVEVELRLASTLRMQAGADPSTQSLAARILNNLGNRLSALGRREEALAATAEAVRLYRQLAVQRPDDILHYLAAALSNLGNWLSALGRREEALAASDEATGLYRQLAEQRPDAFLPDLAGALNNLGNQLSDLGRREKALAAALEATGLYRQLAGQRP